jgi:hypothetical protein
MLLDKVNGNCNWHDAITKEIEQMNEYEVFKDKGKAKSEEGKEVNAPQG